MSAQGVRWDSSLPKESPPRGVIDTITGEFTTRYVSSTRKGSNGNPLTRTNIPLVPTDPTFTGSYRRLLGSTSNLNAKRESIARSLGVKLGAPALPYNPSSADILSAAHKNAEVLRNDIKNGEICLTMGGVTTMCFATAAALFAWVLANRGLITMGGRRTRKRKLRRSRPSRRLRRE